ncbi:hypothetical protein FRC12_000597 [Ceratobasidium sp. 428]|nr:hypothetical protein FRC12_000597 [Ceratobasidium sp. 428]
MNDFIRDEDMKKGEPSGYGYSEAQLEPPPYSKNAPSTSSRRPTGSKHDTKPSDPDIATPSTSTLPPPQTSLPPGSWPVLPPACNYFVDRRSNNSVNGTWHVDTALVIPPALLRLYPEFDGIWNFDVQTARKKRDKEQKKRDGWWSKRINGEQPPLPPIKETRPNIMLYSTNGSVNGKIYVSSSDRVARQSLIVAQGNNGSVSLSVNAPTGQPIRIHATSHNGSVTVKIPTTYVGAVTLAMTHGSIKISEGIKTKSTIFSSTATSTRLFVGDWSAANFGTTPDTSAFGSHAVAGPSTASTPPRDPFATWTGPLVHLGTTNGSVHISFVDEDFITELAAGISKAVRNVMNGIFG